MTASARGSPLATPWSKRTSETPAPQAANSEASENVSSVFFTVLSTR
jgi:hypothetical protein